MTSWTCFLYHELVRESLRRSELGHSIDFLLFEKQLNLMKENYDVVAPAEAIDAILKGRKGRFATIWFDDAYKSVLDIGLPILRRHKITAVVSVCSSFYRNTDVFWRKKLAVLLMYGHGPRLSKYFVDSGVLSRCTNRTLMRESLNEFSVGLIQALNQYVCENGLGWLVEPVFEEFCDKSDILSLIEHEWVVANHSANHFPITEPSAFDLITTEFANNEMDIISDFGLETDFYVAPFCREGMIDVRVSSFADELHKREKYLVLVNELDNSRQNLKDGIIFRKTARAI